MFNLMELKGWKTIAARTQFNTADQAGMDIGKEVPADDADVIAAMPPA